ncbi:7032_t:CDS:2 [Acaulospora morrowiae]|uniref:7032_t:CDS:1 n=1 Tax=Acaulospora morrowiae TaxID=94023 RepID=A0A9N9B7D3_9GLOM|nr:7032_t:CDS:2 [Acaulospora morrowiae]
MNDEGRIDRERDLVRKFSSKIAQDNNSINDDSIKSPIPMLRRKSKQRVGDYYAKRRSEVYLDEDEFDSVMKSTLYKAEMNNERRISREKIYAHNPQKNNYINDNDLISPISQSGRKSKRVSSYFAKRRSEVYLDEDEFDSGCFGSIWANLKFIIKKIKNKS